MSPDQPVLRDGQPGRDALPIQVLQQFMHVQDQRVLLRHRLLIAVQAIDHHGARAGDLNAIADLLRELAGRQLRRVDLLHRQISKALDHRLQIDAPEPWRGQIAGPVPRRR